MSSDNKELVLAMQVLEEEKGISREVIKEALESALILAYKRNYDQAQNVEVEFNTEKGSITLYSVKEVVEEVEDKLQEISLEDARQIHRAYEVGDKIRFEEKPKDFGRIAAQTAKHVVLQRLREAERENVYDQFIPYEDEILTGVVDRHDQRYNVVYIAFDNVEAAMPQREQIPGEVFEMDQRVKVYVQKVDKTTRGPQIIVSRSDPNFLRRLFEQEVPEIYDGVVEIMAIAREAGDRSKVAVRSRDSDVDPVGTCVGQGGERVQTIVEELAGENMDIIEYNEDPAIFIKNAMSPAEVIEVVETDEENSCIVVVPDHQLSLAIGKRGQNARLAARLTGYRIDIKSQTDYQEYKSKLASSGLTSLKDALIAAQEEAGLSEDGLVTGDELAQEETSLVEDGLEPVSLEGQLTQEESPKEDSSEEINLTEEVENSVLADESDQAEDEEANDD